MVTIRQFQPEDKAEVVSLFVEGQRQFSAGIEAELEAYIQETLQEDLADIWLHYILKPGSGFWVAEVEGQVIGTAGVQRRSPDMAELRRMSVDIRWRRQGIGERLLHETETFALQQGYKVMRLSTITPLKPAISLYEKAGYRLTGTSNYGAVTVLHYSKNLISRFDC